MFGVTRQAEETLDVKFCESRFHTLLVEVVNIGSHNHETREEGQDERERILESSRWWTFLVEVSPMFDQWAEGLSCPFPD